jgi:hypothetical protein
MTYTSPPPQTMVCAITPVSWHFRQYFNKIQSLCHSLDLHDDTRHNYLHFDV